MRLSRSVSVQMQGEPARSIPKGWYWLAALALSLALWWGIFELAVLVLRRFA